MRELRVEMEEPSFDQVPRMMCRLSHQVQELANKIDAILINSKSVIPVDEKRFNGDRELADYLDCTVQTVSRLKKAGRLTFHRFGRRYYYLRSEIDSSFKNKV